MSLNKNDFDFIFPCELPELNSNDEMMKMKEDIDTALSDVDRTF
jgi:hypothetical protein